MTLLKCVQTCDARLEYQAYSDMTWSAFPLCPLPTFYKSLTCDALLEYQAYSDMTWSAFPLCPLPTFYKSLTCDARLEYQAYSDMTWSAFPLCPLPTFYKSLTCDVLQITHLWHSTNHSPATFYKSLTCDARLEYQAYSDMTWSAFPLCPLPTFYKSLTCDVLQIAHLRCSLGVPGVQRHDVVGLPALPTADVLQITHLWRSTNRSPATLAWSTRRTATWRGRPSRSAHCRRSTNHSPATLAWSTRRTATWRGQPSRSAHCRRSTNHSPATFYKSLTCDARLEYQAYSDMTWSAFPLCPLPTSSWYSSSIAFSCSDSGAEGSTPRRWQIASASSSFELSCASLFPQQISSTTVC